MNPDYEYLAFSLANASRLMLLIQPAAASCNTVSADPTISINGFTTPASCMVIQLSGSFDSWKRALAVDLCTCLSLDFR